MIKEFDSLGRHRVPDYDRQLAEVRKRANDHLRNCKHCLQHRAGFRKHKCPTGNQIDGHERVVLEAQRRKEAGEL